MQKAKFHSDFNFISISVSGMPDLEDFKEIANSAISLLKAHNTNKILNNVTKLEVNSIENQEWTQQVWFPEAEKNGLKYFAFVVPSDIFGKVSAEQTNEVAEEEGRITIKYFESYDEAVNWLKTCK